MSPDATPDEGEILAGLEHAVANARQVFDDGAFADAVAPLPAAPGAAAGAVDGSAVMEVLRDALDRYAADDHRGPDLWTGAPLAESAHTAVHPVAQYRRDRRRMLAGVVIFLFVLGGAAFATMGHSSTPVKTAPTRQGQSVTTLSRQASTSVTALPSTTTTEAPATSGVTTPHATATSAPRTTSTTGTTDTTVPDTTDTTVPDTTDTTVPDTTTSSDGGGLPLP